MPSILNRHTITLILCAFALSSWACPEPDKDAPATAARARLQAFYAYHFAHKREITRQTLDARRKWLASGLYNLLRYELGRKLPPDEAPYIEGDPFTNSQEVPSQFRIGQVRVSGPRAGADVQFTWTEGGKVVSKRTCVVKLAHESGTWKISDILGDRRQSLADDLRRLKQQDASAKGKPQSSRIGAKTLRRGD
jgi:hypothetical protein